MSDITYTTIPASNDPDGWVCEYRIDGPHPTSGTYTYVCLGGQLRVYMTRQERDAIVNDGRFHHTSRACVGCTYRVWNPNLPDRSDTAEQLGPFKATR